jgi:hypothetical protein
LFFFVLYFVCHFYFELNNFVLVCEF